MNDQWPKSTSPGIYDDVCEDGKSVADDSFVKVSVVSVRNDGTIRLVEMTVSEYMETKGKMGEHMVFRGQINRVSVRASYTLEVVK